MFDSPRDAPDFQEVVGNLTDMPALPSVVARLGRLIADPKTTATDINNALSADPGLVTRILKLVNSSYYGFPRRITTITNAVVILGFNQVRNLALSTFIFDSFARTGKNSPFDLKGFWRHSIGTAFLAGAIAQTLNARLTEDAFVCGLLHDLGKFIMARKAQSHIVRVNARVAEREILFYEAEHQVLQYDHAQLGSYVMEQWNLPETLVNVVRCHHNPLLAPETARELSCVTNMADIVARALLMGNPGDERIPRLTAEVWEVCGLDWKKLDDIIRKVAEDYSKSDAFFSA